MCVCVSCGQARWSLPPYQPTALPPSLPPSPSLPLLPSFSLCLSPALSLCVSLSYLLVHVVRLSLERLLLHRFCRGGFVLRLVVVLQCILLEASAPVRRHQRTGTSEKAPVKTLLPQRIRLLHTQRKMLPLPLHQLWLLSLCLVPRPPHPDLDPCPILNTTATSQRCCCCC